jgi:hypothetical protein
MLTCYCTGNNCNSSKTKPTAGVSSLAGGLVITAAALLLARAL